jgi:alpha-tubulin suppressor-like RCC1 family protein
LNYHNGDIVGDDETPASVGTVPVGETVVQIAAAGSHACALLSTGNVRCWGSSYNGYLGYGNLVDVGEYITPAQVGDVNVGGPVKQIAVTETHTCALLTNGKVRCWGESDVGQLGYGNTNNIGDDETPASAGDVDVGGDVQQIAVGGAHTCALLTSGEVRCWGFGISGQLGYGNLNNIGDDETPASAGSVDVGAAVRQISVGGLHTCVVTTSGGVRCWGDGGAGALGYGNRRTLGDDEAPSVAGDVPLF